MARRKVEQRDKPSIPAAMPAGVAPTPSGEPVVRPAEPDPRDSGATRVLVATTDPAVRDLVAARLRDGALACDFVPSLTAAISAVVATDYDAALVDLCLPDGAGLDVVRRAALEKRHTRFVMLAPTPSVDDAVEAMRTGAVDLLASPPREAELAAAVVAAAQLARADRERTRRVDRLKRICRRLNTARQQVTSHVDVLCNDLVGAYRELADQVSQVSLASEFASIVQQELDVESLLRTALEYMLTKTGPTNAAVFLPSNHSDFNLGAYVNYDCPRDTADVLLDHLADVIAPRFQDEPEIIRFDDEAELAEWIGDDAHWLAESRVIVFSCRHEGECLAVMTLFRDQNAPFADELVPQLKVMSDLFARQLARIIRIHHRHTPGKEWSGFDAWEDDEDGGITA